MLDEAEALRAITALETKLHSAESKVRELEAEAGAMRESLHAMVGLWEIATIGKSLRVAMDCERNGDEANKARAALSSTAGASLLAELSAYREGWEAWEAWGEADGAIVRTTAREKQMSKERSHMKALSRAVHDARASIASLKKGSGNG